MTRNGFVPLTSALFDIVPAVNEQLFRFDGLQGSVKSMTANRPASPAEGDVYLVTSDLSWSSLPIGTIAHYWGGFWRNYTAALGQIFTVQDQNYKAVHWSGGWTSLMIEDSPTVIIALSANIANQTNASIIAAYTGGSRLALTLPSLGSGVRNTIVIRGKTTAGFSVSGGTILLPTGATTTVGLRNITGFPCTTLRLLWDGSQWLSEYDLAQVEVGV
jgi:hypothetical protein